MTVARLEVGPGPVGGPSDSGSPAPGPLRGPWPLAASKCLRGVHRRGRTPRIQWPLFDKHIHFLGPTKAHWLASLMYPGHQLAGSVPSAQPRHGPIATILRRTVCMFGCAILILGYNSSGASSLHSPVYSNKSTVTRPNLCHCHLTTGFISEHEFD